MYSPGSHQHLQLNNTRYIFTFTVKKKTSWEYCQWSQSDIVYNPQLCSASYCPHNLIILKYFSYSSQWPKVYKVTFDTFDHNILLYNVVHYGIMGLANDWFCSYLSNQQQFVSIDSASSSSFSFKGFHTLHLLFNN